MDHLNQILAGKKIISTKIFFFFTLFSVLAFCDYQSMVEQVQRNTTQNTGLALNYGILFLNYFLRQNRSVCVASIQRHVNGYAWLIL